MMTRIYLDNCCFNRPYDDQSQLRIRLESEAKLGIQENIRAGKFELVWSYIVDYENNRNPFRERREQIAKWRGHSGLDIEEEAELLELATQLNQHGINRLDALHIACAIRAKADFFLTTDDGLLRKAILIDDVRITDPIGFVKEVQT